MPQRSNKLPLVIGSAPSKLEGISAQDWERANHLATLLRPTLGNHLSAEQAQKLAIKAKVGVSTLHRFRKRLAESNQVTALLRKDPGFKATNNRLAPESHNVILQVIERLQRQGRRIQMVEIYTEVKRRCHILKIEPPHRRSVDRRVSRHAPQLVTRRHGNVETPESMPPGRFVVQRALEVVQIDHTKCDVMVVDELHRQSLGRPILSIAMDVATRCVLGYTVSFESPSSASVAYLLTRVVAAKDAWLKELGVNVVWPMAGLPSKIHMDNAKEFHSQALLRGCEEFGIEIIHRPLARPHFGGHIERMIGTLMSRLKGLPGATGSSVKQRKGRDPEKRAVLTLKEFDAWLALEIGERYHHSEHHGLPGATPAGAWSAAGSLVRPVKNLAAFNAAFLPAVQRTLVRGCIHFHHIQYWHALLPQHVDAEGKLVVHYDPTNLSHLYLLTPQKELLAIPYAQTQRPVTTLWEVLATGKYLRAKGEAMVNEERLFSAIQSQRTIVAKAANKTRNLRSDKSAPKPARSLTPTQAAKGELDYSQPPGDYPAEVWVRY